MDDPKVTADVSKEPAAVIASGSETVVFDTSTGAVATGAAPADTSDTTVITGDVAEAVAVSEHPAVKYVNELEAKLNSMGSYVVAETSHLVASIRNLL